MAAPGSIGSALILVTLKVFLALATGGLGVLSEALHSCLDLVAAILTCLSVRVSDRPADSGHTYDHGKFENVSGFAEIGLLPGTSVLPIQQQHRHEADSLLFRRDQARSKRSWFITLVHAAT
ncbi:MAG: cation transporter, partial [Acidobacteriia bacterium]|nr:cation transporter [Terriglobia bacterium]